MDTNDVNSEKKKVKPKNLEEMSIEALGEYINELKEEIDRVKKVIVSKEVAQKDAQSFFKWYVSQNKILYNLNSTVFSCTTAIRWVQEIERSLPNLI